MNDFSHLDKKGNVKMVDVSEKDTNARVARAEGRISMLSKTILSTAGSEFSPSKP